MGTARLQPGNHVLCADEVVLEDASRVTARTGGRAAALFPRLLPNSPSMHDDRRTGRVQFKTLRLDYGVLEFGHFGRMLDD
jgi:hypothetical protein